ncbi:MAG: hypothetical protein J6N78_06135 [Clostridia bacterium]|nr:hypothetical protein [Clostridia bacterium]
MGKIIKSILILLFAMFITFGGQVLAVDLDSEENETSNVSNSASNQTSENETSTNSTSKNTSKNTTNTSTNSYSYDDDTIGALDSEPATTKVSNINSDSGNNMSLILNVFIIVIGILLILLAIDILIKLKK